jgi:hypothetical protein
MAAIIVLFIIDWFIFGYKDKYFLGLSYTISCFLAYYFTIEWYSGKDRNKIRIMTQKVQNKEKLASIHRARGRTLVLTLSIEGRSERWSSFDLRRLGLIGGWDVSETLRLASVVWPTEGYHPWCGEYGRR